MPTPSLLALSQNRLRHGDPKWSKTALSAGKRSDAVKAAFVIGERGAIRSLTRFDDMPDENDVIAGFEVMIAQTFQMGDAAFDQGSAQQAGAARDAVELVRNGTRETHRQFILPLPQDGDGKGLAFLEMATAGGRRADRKSTRLNSSH